MKTETIQTEAIGIESLETKINSLPDEVSKLNVLGFKLDAQGSSVYLLSKREEVLMVINEQTLICSAIVDPNSKHEIELIKATFRKTMYECKFLIREANYNQKLKKWFLENTHLFNSYMAISEWHNATIFELQSVNLGAPEIDMFYKEKMFKFAEKYNKKALQFSYHAYIKPTTDLLFKSEYIEVRANSNELIEINYLAGFVELYYCETSNLVGPVELDAESSSINSKELKISDDTFNKKILNLIQTNFAETRLQELWSKGDLFPIPDKR